MAGKHIYLEPILSQATGGLDQIVQNIDENVTAEINKLDEVANLLTQILYQSGLTQQQYVVNGATLSALTLKSFAYSDTNYSIANNCVDVADVRSYNTAIGIETGGFYFYRRSVNDNYVVYIEKDLTNINTLKIDLRTYHTNSSGAAQLAKIKINDDVVYSESLTNNGALVPIEIDTTGYTGVCKIYFNGCCSSSSTSNESSIHIYNIRLIDNSNTEYNAIQPTDKLVFSNNTIVKTNNNNAAAKGYLIIPLTTLTISQLNTLLTVGELEGVKINNYKQAYSKLINELSVPVGSLNQNVDFTNLYLELEFTNADSVITSFTVRYV